MDTHTSEVHEEDLYPRLVVSLKSSQERILVITEPSFPVNVAKSSWVRMQMMFTGFCYSV